MIKHFRNNFISGLIVLAPLVATLFVVNLLMVKLGRPVSDFILQFLDPSIRSVPGINPILDIAAIIIVVVLITVLGYFSKYFIGKIIVMAGEQIIDRVPFVNTVYKTVKQIVDTFSKQNKAVFQSVVLTEYPRKGVYVLGFLTSKAQGEVQEKTGATMVNIFVPTTPNPTSGFLLMVPDDEVIDMQMSVADGMKLIVSGGAVNPPWPPPPPAPSRRRKKKDAS